MNRAASDVAVLGAVFLAITGFAELLGAANMGTALTFGELGFVAALSWLLTRR
jgi:hypothetical protein